MKILTLNTWQERGPWKKRWQITLEALQKYQPDIVCFQEVFNLDWAREVSCLAMYPSLALADPSSGLVIMSRYQFHRTKYITLTTKSLQETYLRFALFAEVDMNGARLGVFNTHLSWKLNDGEVRENQVQELLDFMAEEASGMDHLITGDFNAPPEAPEIQKMINSGFGDSFDTANPGAKDITWDNRNIYVQAASEELPDRRIDYIFVKPEGGFLGGIRSCEILLREPNKEGIFASDHYAVMSEFKGNQNG